MFECGAKSKKFLRVFPGDNAWQVECQPKVGVKEYYYFHSYSFVDQTGKPRGIYLQPVIVSKLLTIWESQLVLEKSNRDKNGNARIFLEYPPLQEFTIMYTF